MARSVKKGPFIDESVLKAVERDPRWWPAPAGDQDLVAPFDDYA